MMHQQKSKKVFIYIFLFLIITTFNNKNLNNFNIGKINNISINGLDKKNNFQLIENLNFLDNKNIFFLNKNEIKNVIEENTLVEKYSVFRLYPSALSIDINKTNFLAVVKKNGDNFFFRIKR